MGKPLTEKKLIENQKARKHVFEKRRTGLLKKAMELSILCDIKMLVILYSKDKQEPEIWPDNDEEAEQIIGEKPWGFPSTTKKARFGPQFSLSDHKNMINHYSKNELRDLVSDLDDKISAIANLIESKQVPLTAPKMLSDYQETGFLLHPNHNFISYPEFDPSSCTSTIPFVPLPIHHVDPSSTQQPPNTNADPMFHYVDASSMQQPPNMTDIPLFHNVDPSLMQQQPNMNASPSFHYVDQSLMQQPYYDPNIYHVLPFIYNPIMPGFSFK